MEKKVLLIDDESALLSALQFFLEDAGHTVIAASDAETALSLMDTHEPDVIVCDVHLPFMDGFQLCQVLRLDPRWRAIRFVISTAALTEATVLRGREVGVTRFLAKPFGLEDLLSIVQDD
jgi:two-component system alkaline phosphatase synthesis response regulator PhoP